MNMIMFGKHFNVLNMKGTEYPHSLHVYQRAGKERGAQGERRGNVPEPQAVPGRAHTCQRHISGY